MVEKTEHDIAPYIVQKVFSYKKDCCNVAVNSGYLLSGQKNHWFWSKTTPTDYIVEKTYHLSRYLGPFGAYFMPQGPK